MIYEIDTCFRIGHPNQKLLMPLPVKEPLFSKSEPMIQSDSLGTLQRTGVCYVCGAAIYGKGENLYHSIGERK